ncbi:heparinase II/III family protein [Aestuariibius sp. 2305UL40-4]|uniref:heparinase II/III family protein n=1 Tax=Aestuariibius violaceus TaxID=3234132 RepID=UPI00398E5F00
MAAPHRNGWRARQDKWLNRANARLSGLSHTARRFVSQPEPRAIGDVARGRQFVAGNVLYAGHLVELGAQSPWNITPPTDAFEDALHSFFWLDDLAALGDAPARKTAQAWTADWAERFGNGTGPGWTPALAGRRLIRLTQHAPLLLRKQTKEGSDALFATLSRQTAFVARRWRAAPPGLPRFEALTGLLYASLSLDGMDRHRAAASAGLDRECAARIDSEGGLPSRNPEELLDVFSLLSWAAAALADCEAKPGPEHQAALERIAPTLRALRHPDGSLARFHGGDAGPEGRLDEVLAASGIRTRPGEGLHMGYGHLSAGRTHVIVDAAPPPMGAVSPDAHASSCAIEVMSGRRPLIVNCGPGRTFGATWHRAGRATPSHSTLCLEGLSSGRLARRGGAELMVDGPRDVPTDRARIRDGHRFEVAHDGYRASHGLIHARTLELTIDGRGLAGEDLLTTLDPADEKRFERVIAGQDLNGIAFTIRFHLHPDARVAADPGGASASIALKSGEVWILRADGFTDLTIEPSAYLQKTRLKPRSAQQVVLSGRAMSYATRVRWSLAKAQQTPDAIRDLAIEAEDDEDHE